MRNSAEIAKHRLQGIVKDDRKGDALAAVEANDAMWKKTTDELKLVLATSGVSTYILLS